MSMSSSSAPGPQAASSPPGRTYADAIDLLNTFQSSFAQIEARRKAGIFHDASSIDEMKAHWARLGHSQDDLTRLHILHVAGTKGKGSVCAFTASILSQYATTTTAQQQHQPLKIGLHTSPHLVAVRERIRLNNEPLSEPLFAHYFFDVHDRLRAHGVHPMPIYARFLTLLAYHVFVSERVSLAVVETGLGGRYDATNFPAAPLATAIATLGIDHVAVLGADIASITAHKAGIMKPDVPALAVEQPAFPESEQLLRAHAAEAGVHPAGQLRIVGIDKRLADDDVAIRPQAAFQRRNASLAIALAEIAVQTLGLAPATTTKSLPREFKEGLERVVWRGRCEVKDEGRVRWYIDGAHTTDSLRTAAVWFGDESRLQKGPRVLVFNQQGRAEAVEFLEGLFAGSKREDGTAFDYAFFCTNVTFAETGYKRDFVNNQHDPEAIKNLTMQRRFAEAWAVLDPKTTIAVVPSIEETINRTRNLAANLKEGESVQAFITGSLHLVGGALGILEGADAL